MEQQVSASGQYVVVADATGQWWEGSVVDYNRAQQLHARGVDLLPCEPKLFSSGVGGFMKRSWGAGWPLDYSTPRMSCPITLFIQRPGDVDPTRDCFDLFWRARLTVSPELEKRVRAGERIEGMLRFTSDGGQPFPAFATYASKEHPIHTAKFGPPDEAGGWTVGGQGQVNISQPGHYAFGLYGCAPGLRVVWAAASLARA